MEKKLARKFSEIKMARSERHHICGGARAHREAAKAYNRAFRRTKHALRQEA